MYNIDVVMYNNIIILCIRHCAIVGAAKGKNPRTLSHRLSLVAAATAANDGRRPDRSWNFAIGPFGRDGGACPSETRCCCRHLVPRAFKRSRVVVPSASASVRFIFFTSNYFRTHTAAQDYCTYSTYLILATLPTRRYRYWCALFFLTQPYKLVPSARYKYL